VRAKQTVRHAEADRYKKSVADIVTQEKENGADADSFVFQKKRRKRGAPRKTQEKAQLATFSLTKEDLQFVEQATWQVIQALNKRVNKSQTVRLAMRTFAGLSIEELKQLLSRPPAQTLTEQLIKR
jgi:hypothetical protein